MNPDILRHYVIRDQSTREAEKWFAMVSCIGNGERSLVELRDFEIIYRRVRVPCEKISHKPETCE